MQVAVAEMALLYPMPEAALAALLDLMARAMMVRMVREALGALVAPVMPDSVALAVVRIAVVLAICLAEEEEEEEMPTLMEDLALYGAVAAAEEDILPGLAPPEGMGVVSLLEIGR